MDVSGSARRITPGTPVSPGNRAVIAAASAGYVRLVMDAGGFLDVYAVVGTTHVPNVRVKDVDAAGSTSTDFRVSVL